MSTLTAIHSITDESGVGPTPFPKGSGSTTYCADTTTARPSRIWVPNWAGHDFSPALAFTTLEPGEAFVALTSGDVNVLRTDRLLYQIRCKLAEFDEQDYLVVSGHPMIFAVALHVLLQRLACVRLLHWSPKLRAYQAGYISARSFTLPLFLEAAESGQQPEG